jgi:putative ABC transport system permease protein
MARRYFPNENPIGKRLALGGVRNRGQAASPNPGAGSPWSEIVGVAGNIKSLGPNPGAAPMVYFSYWQWPMQSPTLLARSVSDPSAIAAAIRAGVKAANKNLPEPAIRTMDQILSGSAARPRFQAVLMGLFGIVALLLAAVGAYGVMSCFVAQRTHEIGVRLALGARRWNVLALVVGQGMRLAVAGVGIGLAIALGLTRMMAGLLFEVEPDDPLTFALISAVLLIVAFFACWLPARRAARVDPMVALRAE